MKWFKKYLTKTIADEQQINGITVIDKRDIKTEIPSKIIDDDDDPYMSIMVNTAFESGKPVYGSIDEDGKLTIK